MVRRDCSEIDCGSRKAKMSHFILIVYYLSMKHSAPKKLANCKKILIALYANVAYCAFRIRMATRESTCGKSFRVEAGLASKLSIHPRLRRLLQCVFNAEWKATAAALCENQHSNLSWRRENPAPWGGRGGCRRIQSERTQMANMFVCLSPLLYRVTDVKATRRRSDLTIIKQG